MICNIKKFIQSEISGWKIGEIAWLLIACLIIIGLSIYWDDTVMGIISATSGVACVILTGKGKLSAYFFGIINCILYAIIAYNASLYGETMLNIIYYLPMQFIGFYVWNNNINEKTHEVIKKSMKNKTRIMLLFLIFILVIVYAFILQWIGDAMPFVDSFTTISSIAAMIISVKMYSEQWWIWIVVNLFSIYMWSISYMIGSDNIATLLMWTVYLINSIFMAIRWHKESKLLGR